jgi:hypothetical protein
MAKFSYHKTGDLGVTLKDFYEKVQADAVRREDTLLIELNNRILALTPVWEGELIRNWRWSTKAPVFEHVDPIQSPSNPGHTGKSEENPAGMTLGEEPRRAANQLRPKQSLAGALTAKTPVDIFLTNASPIAVDAEYGLVPTPDRSRSPAGIVRIALRQVFGDA